MGRAPGLAHEGGSLSRFPAPEAVAPAASLRRFRLRCPDVSGDLIRNLAAAEPGIDVVQNPVAHHPAGNIGCRAHMRRQHRVLQLDQRLRHYLIDSTGIKVEGEGEWHARKHGGPKLRVWRKIHLGVDEKMLEVRAEEITGSHIGDASVLPDLLKQIPAHEQIGSVTANGAYDTRKCHNAIADCGAHAVIPPRKSAKLWKTVTTSALAIVLGRIADSFVDVSMNTHASLVEL